MAVGKYQTTTATPKPASRRVRRMALSKRFVCPHFHGALHRKPVAMTIVLQSAHTTAEREPLTRMPAAITAMQTNAVFRPRRVRSRKYPTLPNPSSQVRTIYQPNRPPLTNTEVGIVTKVPEMEIGRASCRERV